MGNPFAVREKAVYDESFVANTDMSGDQYKIVKLHTVAGQVVLAGAGEGIGVLQNKPGAGQEAKVRLFGISRVVVDGSGTSIAPGQFIKSDASGIGVRSTTANDLPIGQFLTGGSVASVTTAGVVGCVLLIGPLRDHA